MRVSPIAWISLLLMTSSDGYSVNRYTFLTSSASTMVAGVFAKDGYFKSSPTTDTGGEANPRYLDKDVQMTYGTDPDGNPRSRGLLVRRFTGDSTPFSFPVSPIRLVKEWPEEPPFTDVDFSRADEIFDGSFYAVPRFVYHIDEPAVAALTQFYRKEIKPKSDILDICSSWVSHYPLEFPKTMGRISATGMNAFELKANDQLKDWQQRDLNDNTELPYEDNSFDVVTCVVSIDYLVKPIEVLKEIHRVLRPGGKVIISQSNRCFPSKAISMWLKMNDRQHLELINGYFQYAGGFKPREAFDITAEVPGNSYNDPMFIVTAVKK
mmetsp:Transcript_20423/g.30456  ORF Transcript_20423/g.30456 Transcript_20423/m.30456 type:complete len:323 (-) Transcript_20423:211-1179(-)